MTTFFPATTEQGIDAGRLASSTMITSTHRAQAK
jgi:hypothetical protein